MPGCTVAGCGLQHPDLQTADLLQVPEDIGRSRRERPNPSRADHGKGLRSGPVTVIAHPVSMRRRLPARNGLTHPSGQVNDDIRRIRERAAPADGTEGSRRRARRATLVAVGRSARLVVFIAAVLVCVVSVVLGWATHNLFAWLMAAGMLSVAISQFAELRLMK